MDHKHLREGLTDLLILVKSSAGFVDVVGLLFPFLPQVSDGNIGRTWIRCKVLRLTDNRLNPSA